MKSNKKETFYFYFLFVCTHKKKKKTLGIPKKKKNFLIKENVQITTKMSAVELKKYQKKWRKEPY